MAINLIGFAQFERELIGERIREGMAAKKARGGRSNGISEWVQRLIVAGKKPSTVRHAYFLVRMVLAQAVADGRFGTNSAEYVKLPSESSSGTPGVVG